MQNVIVIYHKNCDDGVGAAWVAWKFFNGKEGFSVSFVPADYGDAPPDVTGAAVYILDFSYSPEVVRGMEKTAASIILLDHHKSAMEKWDREMSGVAIYPDATRSAHKIYFGTNGVATFDMDRSGARIAWDYFFPDSSIPVLIHHIEDNDLWLFKDNNTKAFIRNLRSHPQLIDTFEMIHNLVEDPIDYAQFLDEGEAIERYFNQQCQFILSCAVPSAVSIGDAYGLGANVPRTFASELSNILAERCGTFGLTWYTDGLNAVVSLRSKKDSEVDVSKLAAQEGGGGHKNAAGFTVPLRYFVEDILGL
jgi:oligoribonuclease NrnB/cAMP/cGMP phosphodiesterase (DHH superfamily)